MENEKYNITKLEILLTKICEDFKIKDSDKVIKTFLKNKGKTI